LNEKSEEILCFKSENFIENISAATLVNIFGKEPEFLKQIQKNVIENYIISTIVTNESENLSFKHS